MNYQELMALPNGVIFCEDNISAAPLYKKVETFKNDITVKPIFSLDDETIGYGFSIMSECDLNSLDFHVLSDAENRQVIDNLVY